MPRTWTPEQKQAMSDFQKKRHAMMKGKRNKFAKKLHLTGRVPSGSIRKIMADLQVQQSNINAAMDALRKIA